MHEMYVDTSLIYHYYHKMYTNLLQKVKKLRHTIKKCQQYKQHKMCPSTVKASGQQ